MHAFRRFLVGFANALIVVVILAMTTAGFILGSKYPISFWNTDSFNVTGAITGAIIGFLFGCSAMSVLVVLLDIRALLAQLLQRNKDGLS